MPKLKYGATKKNWNHIDSAVIWMSLKESYLHDYLVASLLGSAFGMLMASPAGASIAIGNWGPAIGALAIAGIFGFVPGGLIAGYVNFRFHRMGENMEMAGLSAGFFAAVVFMFIDLILSVEAAIMNTAVAANIFIGWILTVVFGFIFFTVGGYLSGMLERRPFAVPAMFDLSKLQRSPPPPPAPGGAIQACPICGQPLTFVQRYGRWYCGNCKKYA